MTIAPDLELLSVRFFYDNDRPDLFIYDTWFSSRLDGSGHSAWRRDNYYVGNGTWTVSEVPLPAPLLLLIGGIGVLGLVRGRRRGA